MEWEDDRSRYNGQSAAELSPYVRIDAWLARLKQQQEAQAPLLPPSPPPPAFFLVSGTNLGDPRLIDDGTLTVHTCPDIT